MSVAACTTRVNPNIKDEDVATMLLDHGAGCASICAGCSRL